ncbi:MAG: hypothetical protein GY863_20055 [bacterium]|nr:hypothetical protein [bacterium]
MKFIRYLTVITLIAILTGTANGQFRKNVISFDTGAPIPISPNEFQKHWDPYITFGLGLEHRITTHISFGVSGNISLFQLLDVYGDGTTGCEDLFKVAALNKPDG